jgi:hypothetical protein
MTSFFFSYASHDHATASLYDINSGRDVNLLDLFYEELCRAVAGRLGPEVDVSYRDQPSLRIGAVWPDALTAALQHTRSLVVLLSPSYLESENCGRELRFMTERFDRRPGNVHCVIPVFWESNVTCNPFWPQRARDLIDGIQTTTNMQLPREYLAQGFKQWMTLVRLGERQQAYNAIADAIVANYHAEPLAPYPAPVPFPRLPTMLGAAAREEQSGPSTAQIVYVVAQRAEVEAARMAYGDRYASKRQQWRPFGASPDTTVAAATENGVTHAGLSYQDRGWPRGLVNRLREARADNSVVLFVLDRRALGLPKYANPMKRYAETDDLPNVGLVTAGGADVTDAAVELVFQDRFRQRPRNHLWSVASDREMFESRVSETVNSVKRDLMRAGMQPDEHTASEPPRLTGPTGAAL